MNMLRLKNFKGIAELNVPINQFTVIVGKNNIGKTSILEAMYMLRNQSINNTREMLWSRGISNIFYYLPYYYRNNSYILDDYGELHIKSSKENVYVGENEVKTFLKIDINDFVSDVAENSKYTFNSKEIFIADYINKSLELSIYLRPILQTDKIFIDSLLSRFYNYKEFRVNSIDRQIFIDNGSDLIPLSMYGTGLHRALLMLLAVIHSKNSVLYIDEIETGLHTEIMPEYFEGLFYLAKKYNVSLMIATHSDDIIKSFAKSDIFVSSAVLNKVYMSNNKLNIKSFTGNEVKEARLEWRADLRI